MTATWRGRGEKKRKKEKPAGFDPSSLLLWLNLLRFQSCGTSFLRGLQGRNVKGDLVISCRASRDSVYFIFMSLPKYRRPSCPRATDLCRTERERDQCTHGPRQKKIHVLPVELISH